jgi:hypothetical protein
VRLRRPRRRPEPHYPSITCPRCAMTSCHPMDVRYGYCPDCDDYTSAPTPPGDIVERVRARYGREAAESVRRVLVEDR